MNPKAWADAEFCARRLEAACEAVAARFSCCCNRHCPPDCNGLCGCGSCASEWQGQAHEDDVEKEAG